MRAIGYLRELSDPTLEVQQRAFLDCCARGGLEVGPTFTETAAESGSPEFLRMVRVLDREERGFTVVVVASLNVFGANVRDQARRYLQLEASGLPPKLADGHDVNEALAQAWARRRPEERRRDQVREAMRNRALRGEVLGRPPHGYRIVDRHLEPDPEEADVVREIFRACLDEGEGVRRIARRLNEAGRLTRRGGAWSTASVRDILRNPVYTGTYRRLGVVVPRAHEALIDGARFEAVQRTLAQRRTSPARQRRRQYLLAGLVRCGYCGNGMIGARRPRASADGGPTEHVYYQCGARANQSRCAYHTRRAEDLEAAVRKRIARPPRRRATANAGDHDAVREQARRLDSQRRARERELDRMLERRAAGQWTPLQLRARAAPLVLADLEQEEREAAASGEVGPAPDAVARKKELEQTRKRLAGQWDDVSFEERRDLLREVVARIVVTDDDVVVQFAV